MTKGSRVETLVHFMESQPAEIQLEAGMAASGSLVALGGLALDVFIDQETLSTTVTGIGLGVLAVGAGLFALNKASDFMMDRIHSLAKRNQKHRP